MSIKTKRYLALDIGTKRIGVAKWDPAIGLVQPVTLIQFKRPREALESINEICKDFSPTGLVLGYPLMPNGKPGEIARVVLKWKEKLEVSFPDSVFLWDERMTSKLAERDLSTLGLTTKQIRSAVDVAAAMRILENWIAAKDGST